METKITQVTPGMAQKWLSESNVHNRPLYEKTVESYAADMKRGFWALNNQGIGFDEKGTLIDGQHRLQAIVNSGATVPMLIVRGLSENFHDGHLTQETVDQGKPRMAGDILTLTRGLKYANLKVAIIRNIINLCCSQTKRTSVGILWEVIKIYENEINSVVEARSGIKGLNYSPALSAFAFAAKSFLKETIEFEQNYFSGENLSAGDPVLTFRNYMMNRPTNNGGSAYRRMVMFNLLTCLMYHINRIPIKRIVHSAVGFEFFANKQKRTISQVADLFKY
jgi:hypothetical protein